MLKYLDAYNFIYLIYLYILYIENLALRKFFIEIFLQMII